MVNVRQRATRRDGVTFVHVLVENASSERRRVRLALACERAPWPPRRRGVPEAGWDDDGVTVTVAAGNVRGVGFATPEPIEGDAVAVTETERLGGVDTARSDRVDREPSADGVDVEPSADGVVRALGGFAPPLAATPREDATARGDATAGHEGSAVSRGER